MGIYAEYIDKSFNWLELEKERKKQLKRISDIRERAIIVYAGGLNKKADISINFEDRIPFQDQLSNLAGDEIDIILETPGGSAEIAEEFVKMIRNKFSKVGIIIPGTAKSAGTIMAMSGDEILMEPSSALGPIDAQMIQNNKRYSAHAFIEGFNKIKKEIEETNNLNRAYIPILQNISPADLQGCENAQDFSKTLVKEWLSKYKFKYWKTHSSSGKPVTKRQKNARAKKIAGKLCNHGIWLTHGRSITMEDLRNLELTINDYSENDKLYDAIRRYYVLLQITFDTTGIYKVFETPVSQIYKYESKEKEIKPEKANSVFVEFTCPNCNKISKIQANLQKNIPTQKKTTLFPKDNIFNCPYCNTRNDLSSLRRQIELQTKKKIL
jgi:ATP-dependent protease ClpP protease subunit